MPDGPFSPDIGSEAPKDPSTTAQTAFIATPENPRPWSAYIRDKRAKEAADRGVNPTEASKGFLRKFTDTLFTDRPGNAQGFLQAISTGRLAQLSVQDFMQGNYPSAAIEGIIAATLVVSPIRMFNRIRQPIKS